MAAPCEFLEVAVERPGGRLRPRPQRARCRHPPGQAVLNPRGLPDLLDQASTSFDVFGSSDTGIIPRWVPGWPRAAHIRQPRIPAAPS